MTIKSHLIEIGLLLPSIFSNYSYFILADCISEEPSRSMSTRTRHDRILTRSLHGWSCEYSCSSNNGSSFLSKPGPIDPETKSPNSCLKHTKHLPSFSESSRRSSDKIPNFPAPDHEMQPYTAVAFLIQAQREVTNTASIIVNASYFVEPCQPNINIGALWSHIQCLKAS